jgi:cyclic-di-GMP-binding protein
MASFDIVSKVDAQVVENAINVAKKEIANRYDFHGSKSEIDLNKKELTLLITTENEMRLNAIMDIIITRGSKQGIDPRSYDVSKEFYPSGPMVKKDVKLKNGLDKDTMKKIAKAIKDSGLKVQASQMDGIIRVTAKKIDDLQAVIASLRKADFGCPLQFENMKSQ